jgi:hypothetical protein
VSTSKEDIIALATYGIDDNGWAFMTQGPGSAMSNWAHGVYIQAGVNPRYMYSKFKVVRDKSKEFTIDKVMSVQANPQLSLWHIKSIEKQEKQDIFYKTLKV